MITKTEFLPKVFLYSFLILSLLFIEACEKKCYDKTNPDCENYDPCYGKLETKADFIVEENLSPFGKVLGEEVWVKGDTVNGSSQNNPIRFTALYPADSFIWTIGAKTFYTKSVIQSGFPKGRHIPIQLVVINKNPNRYCFPNANERDTIVRSIYTWPATSNDSFGSPNLKFINPYPIRGYFKGTFSDNPSKVEIIRMYDSLSYCLNSFPSWIKSFYVENLASGYATSKNIRDCGRMSSSTAVPFGAWGQCDIFNYGAKDTMVRITFIARLMEDRKTIKIKTETFNIFTAKITEKNEFIGIKID